jgi:uncharacterized membrane protein
MLKFSPMQGIAKKVSDQVWDDAVRVLIAGIAVAARRKVRDCDRAMRRRAVGAFSTRGDQPQ